MEAVRRLISNMKGRTIFVMQEKGIRVGFFLFPIHSLFKKDCDIVSCSVEWKIATYYICYKAVIIH